MKEKKEHYRNDATFDIEMLAQKDDFWNECRAISRREQINALLDAVEASEQPRTDRCIDMEKLDGNTSPEASVIRDLLTPKEGEHEFSAEAYRQIEADEHELNFLLRLQATADVCWERFTASLQQSKEDGDIDRLVELYQTMQVYIIPDSVKRRILRICFDDEIMTIEEAEALRNGCPPTDSEGGGSV